MENNPFVCRNGDKYWYLNDKLMIFHSYYLLHREDGPAIEYANGDKIWCLNSKCHRIDGPTIERANGDKEWYYQGKKINCSSNEEFFRLLKLKVFW